MTWTCHPLSFWWESTVTHALPCVTDGHNFLFCLVPYVIWLHLKFLFYKHISLLLGWPWYLRAHETLTFASFLMACSPWKDYFVSQACFSPDVKWHKRVLYSEWCVVCSHTTNTANAICVPCCRVRILADIEVDTANDNKSRIEILCQHIMYWTKIVCEWLGYAGNRYPYAWPKVL